MKIRNSLNTCCRLWNTANVLEICLRRFCPLHVRVHVAWTVSIGCRGGWLKRGHYHKMLVHSSLPVWRDRLNLLRRKKLRHAAGHQLMKIHWTCETWVICPQNYGNTSCIDAMVGGAGWARPELRISAKHFEHNFAKHRLLPELIQILSNTLDIVDDTASQISQRKNTVKKKGHSTYRMAPKPEQFRDRSLPSSAMRWPHNMNKCPNNNPS